MTRPGAHGRDKRVVRQARPRRWQQGDSGRYMPGNGDVIGTMRRPVRLSGVSLVEMLVCLLLAMLIALIAISLLVSSRATFSAQDNATRLLETGLYALASIERAIRQAGYENWSAAGAALVATPDMSPAILGLDDRRLPDMPAALASAVAPGVNGSDVLAIRFFGSGDSNGSGAGNMLNCAGVAVAEPAAGDLDGGRGWSIFHIARNQAGQSELRCKYRARDGVNWDSESIAPDIDAMQVLYGVDANGDGLPDRFVNASSLNNAIAMPALTPAVGNGLPLPASTANPWNDVVAVRVSLLARGPELLAASPVNKVFDFFGAEYSALMGHGDRGVRIGAAELGADWQLRLRRLFSLTIPLRNRAGYKAATESP
ncbi:MAG: PilW family protein [Lacisediminimonas sp.]|nr:PilW family protein [Lacisediminimonas sp.]